MKTNIKIKNFNKIAFGIIIIILIGYGGINAQNHNVSANNSETSIVNDMAYIITKSTNKSVILNHLQTEKPREIENWMKDLNYWNINNGNDDTDCEGNKPIESWMMDSNYWTKIVAEKEESLKIEDWMQDTDFWSSIDTEFEESKVIECWMSSATYWDNFITNQEEVLEIESWMSDSNYWQNTANESARLIENWMSDQNYWNKIQ